MSAALAGYTAPQDTGFLGAQSPMQQKSLRLSFSALACFVGLVGCSTPSKNTNATSTEAKTYSAISSQPLALTDASHVTQFKAEVATLGVAGKHCFASLPKASVPVDLLENIGYEVGFSEDLREPLWSAYFCGPDVEYTPGVRPSKFKSDDRVPVAVRLNHEDYNRPVPAVYPTYDRGHMSPNFAIASRYGRAAQLETFLMTNIVPQRSTLNQQTWEGLEKLISSTYAQEFGGVWVVVGPIFDDREHVKWYNGKAAIPSAFFCIVTSRDEQNGIHVLALTLDQSVKGERRLGDFITTVKNIETRTGLDFFSSLPNDVERKLEDSENDSREYWNEETMLVPTPHN